VNSEVIATKLKKKYKNLIEKVLIHSKTNDKDLKLYYFKEEKTVP
jgi:hypothetical protein